MPADDYAVAGGGALKLKGGKIQKSKKKRKDKSAANLERSLSAIDDDLHSSSASTSKDVEKHEKKKKSKKGDKDKRRQEDENDGKDGKDGNSGDDDAAIAAEEFKTEAERRHEEIQRRKLLKMFEDGTARPELLKTHKERVEGLNTYLSKLSEHHDMPKIGPG